MNRENWEVKKLGEVCETINGLWTGKKEPFINVGVIRNTNFTKNCKLNDTNIAYIDVELKQFSRRKLEFGDIIVEKSGGSSNQAVGRVVLFEKEVGDFSFSNFTSVLRIKNPKVLNSNFLHRYLSFLYFSGFTEKLQSNTTGIRNLDFNRYKKTLIPIPPLPIQEAIVKELDTLHRLKELQEQQLDEYDNLAQTTFYSMFGDPIENDRGWEVKKLGEIVKFQRGHDLPVANRKKGNIPVYGSNGIVGYHNEMKRDLGVITGRSGTIGKVICSEHPFWPLNTTLYSIETYNNNIIYLTYLLNEFKLERFFNGTGVPTLNRNIIHKEIIIDVPLPLQSQFADRIKKIDEQKELIKQSITQTQMLIDYTMDKYFN